MEDEENHGGPASEGVVPDRPHRRLVRVTREQHQVRQSGSAPERMVEGQYDLLEAAESRAGRSRPADLAAARVRTVAALFEYPERHGDHHVGAVLQLPAVSAPSRRPPRTAISATSNPSRTSTPSARPPPGRGNHRSAGRRKTRPRTRARSTSSAATALSQIRGLTLDERPQPWRARPGRRQFSACHERVDPRRGRRLGPSRAAGGQSPPGNRPYSVLSSAANLARRQAAILARSQRPPSPATGPIAAGDTDLVRESAHRVPDRVVDPRPAHVHRRAREVDGVQPAANPVTRLHHQALDALTSKRTRGGQPGHARTAITTRVTAPPSPVGISSRPSSKLATSHLRVPQRGDRNQSAGTAQPAAMPP